MENTYEYYLIYIKKDKLDRIPSVTSNPDSYLYGYTQKKSLMKDFFVIHDPNAFLVKKLELTKDAVIELTKECQNNIIRRYKLDTKDDEFRHKQINLAMTEKEFMAAEHQCYVEIESIYKYVWDGMRYLPCLKDKWYDALAELKYHYLSKQLEDGATTRVLTSFEADVAGSFIYLFKSILRG